MGSIGFVVGITLVLSFLAGRELDGWFGTGHFFAIALMFVALIGLTVEFYQIVSEINRDRDEKSSSQDTQE